MSEKCGLTGEHEPTYRSFPHWTRVTCNCAEEKINAIEKQLEIAREYLVKVRDSAIVRSLSQDVPPEIYKEMWIRDGQYVQEAIAKMEAVQ